MAKRTGKSDGAGKLRSAKGGGSEVKSEGALPVILNSIGISLAIVPCGSAMLWHYKSHSKLPTKKGFFRDFSG
jgi:hypothetical protein